MVILAVPDHAGRPYAVARHLQREADGLLLIDPETITHGPVRRHRPRTDPRGPPPPGGNPARARGTLDLDEIVVEETAVGDSSRRRRPGHHGRDAPPPRTRPWSRRRFRRRQGTHRPTAAGPGSVESAYGRRSRFPRGGGVVGRASLRQPVDLRQQASLGSPAAQGAPAPEHPDVVDDDRSGNPSVGADGGSLPN